jgi:hypothetical protein
LRTYGKAVYVYVYGHVDVYDHVEVLSRVAATEL